MKAFFEQFPMEFTEKTALKMMYKVMCEALKKDDNYIEYLERLKDMIEVFLHEKQSEA